jgi:hypothetical protein
MDNTENTIPPKVRKIMDYIAASKEQHKLYHNEAFGLQDPTTDNQPDKTQDLDLSIKPPAFTEMIRSASSSVFNFAQSGFSVVNAETLSARESLCKSCEFWDSEAINGTGRCKICGCATWVKLRMASEECPIGKW